MEEGNGADGFHGTGEERWRPAEREDGGPGRERPDFPRARAGTRSELPARAGLPGRGCRGTGMAMGMVTEIVFLVEEDPEGGYVATAVGAAIVTQAETIEELREAVYEAVHCHFEEDDPDRPRRIRLRFVREEVIAA